MQETTLKILYHIPYPTGTGADRWIYNGWRDAFVDLGHDFHELTAFDDLLQTAKKTKPDIFITWINLVNFEKESKNLVHLREKGVKIFMGIWWPMPPSLKDAEEHLLRYPLVDIYFGEREPEGMYDFEERFKAKYHVIPNAANRKHHFPGEHKEKYAYDIVYLGGKLPKKKWFFDNVLTPLRKKYKVGVFGPYWTFKDNFYRLLVKIFKKIHFRAGVNFFNKIRIQIPDDEENNLYTSAKICLNYHEREPDGSQPHYIINQRAFKIPACGGFQLCDKTPAMQNYFSNDEVATASATEAQEWLKLIDYYITNAKEREIIRQNGINRAIANHTYHNRVEQVIHLYSKITANATNS